jgi:hypothetical protein
MLLSFSLLRLSSFWIFQKLIKNDKKLETNTPWKKGKKCTIQLREGPAVKLKESVESRHDLIFNYIPT